MTDPYIGEVRMVACTYAPSDWSFCDGQVLAIASNQSLFALIGITYGGDGRSTFALPDLRGRAPMHRGQGPGLSNRSLGESGGDMEVSLTEDQIPSHTHALQASDNSANTTDPSNSVLGNVSSSGAFYKTASEPLRPLGEDAIGQEGGNLKHYNMMPYLCLSFIISMKGEFPPRN